MAISQAIIETVVNASMQVELVGETDYNLKVDFSKIEKAIDDLASKSEGEVDKEMCDAVKLIFSNL